MPSMIASVSGSRTFTLMPAPSVDSMSTVPPSEGMFSLTTSMPPPRPARPVTASAVEKPGAKDRSHTGAAGNRGARLDRFRRVAGVRGGGGGPRREPLMGEALEARAGLRQHRLRDDELADQVDELVDLLDRDAQGRGFGGLG